MLTCSQIIDKNYTFFSSIRQTNSITLMFSKYWRLTDMIMSLYQFDCWDVNNTLNCFIRNINQKIQIIIIFGMRQIFAVLLVASLLLAIGECRRKKEKLEQKVETKDERKTVVQANHFYSNTETNTTYDIDGVQKDKALVFFLKPEQGKQDDKTLSDNPISITIDGGSDKATCVFNSYEKMCSLNKVSVDTMKLKIQCKKTPCELSWEIIQPAVSEQDGTYDIDRLVAVNSKSNHGILKVSCNNPELKDTFADEIQLYTNSQYKRVPTKMGTVYFLFGNEDKGYYYILSKSDKAKACANATLTHADEEVSFNEKDIHFDFISTQFSNSYEFKTIPTTDFRMEVSAHDIAFQKLENTTGIKLILLGYKDGTNKVISNFTLLVDDEKDFIDFSAIFKKVTEKYDKLQMEIHGFGNTLIVQSKFIANDIQEIQFGEQSYFTMAKGEKIKYRLVPLVLDNTSPDIKKMFIFVDPAKLFKVNETSCETKGCLFEVQAIENGTGWIYIGESQTKNTKQIIVVPFDKSITKKIREGEQFYYSYKLKADHAIQLLVNTPNVLAYASSKSKCEVVDEQKCYEKIFTYHNPSIYEPIKEDTLLIKVIALDNAEFTITVIDQQSKYIELKDTIPFTYLFDDSEKALYFYFKLSDKQDVSFNLIGPANQLDLLVSNQEKADKESIKDVDWATDGFIKFEKKEINGKNFFIIVRKKETFAKNWVHFTLIASTKQSNMRLQPGVAHYENLQPKDTKDFVFEFIPKKRILLNFYTHNIKSSVNINMKVSNTDDYKDDETTADFTIDSEVDSLDLGLVSKKLCEKEDENCELFVRLQNKMEIDADITITLMISDSVIELKDGIWQNYDINSISSSSHFYYIPNHANHSTTIFYKSSLPDLKIMYNLWKTDDKSMDPSSWPFPVEFKENEKISELSFKPLHFIHVEPSRLKECWPNCVLLLSIAPDFNNGKKSITNDTKFTLLDQDFKIMASNSFIQLPEKHKLDIPLTKGESKEILIDLKYHLSKEAITLYVYYTLGLVSMKANVYTDKNPRCPTTEDEADFKLTGREQSIPIEEIKAKLSQNSMESDDNTPYLCILATAQSDAKITVEFTSDKESIKEIAIDTSTPLSPKSGDKNMFLIYLDQNVYVKISREEGFPFLFSKKCQPQKNGDTSKCVEQFEASEEKGTQLADKVTEFEGAPCDKCLLLFKITSDQPSKMVIHTQSKYAELQLAENVPLSDSLDPQEENRYTLTAAKNEEIIINIQIISGNLKVDVHDFEKIFIAKSNSAGSKNIHIVVPPKDTEKEKKQLGASYMTSFGLSSFIHLHIIINSQNPKESAVYTITYSSGEAITYLQDGLISEYSLAAKKPSKFMYLNPTNSPIYFHATAPEAAQLNKLDVKMFALDNPEDEDSIISMTPEKPDFKKKTPNPTLLMLLPAKKAYLFQVTNNNDKDVLYTLGINNREIIYLPFDHEFPLHLAKAQFIYVVLNTHTGGYVKLSISKCDESYPFIGYTLDYNQFVNEDFQVEEQMTDELSQDLVIKVKEAGGLYFKIRSPDDDTTLMSLKATFSPNKIVPNRSKPGDKGLIQYQLLDSTKAELTFTALVCTGNDKNCGKDFTYTSLSSDKIEQVYAQLACPSIMFDLPDTQVLKSAEVATIPSTNAKGSKITFTQTIKGQIEYVGVRAVNAKTGEVVYYQPVEIVTFWGQVHRTTGTTLILGGIILFFFLCGGLVIYRRSKKSKEYSSLGDVNDEL